MQRLSPLGFDQINLVGRYHFGLSDAVQRGEATTVHFTFATTKLDAVMYRSVDGKVQQFLIAKP